MNKEKKGFISRHLDEIKSTLFPANDADTRLQKTGKNIGWVMFLILMVCMTITMAIAISFAH